MGTTTLYPSVIGQVGHGEAHTDFATIRNGAGTVYTQNGTTQQVVIDLQGAEQEPDWVSMSRGGLVFDPSGIGSPGNVILRLYIVLTFGMFDPTYVNVYSFSPNDETLFAATDYAVANFGSTPYCDTPININDIVPGWIEFIFNSDGRDAVTAAIAASGNLVLGLRMNHDVDNSAPPWEWGYQSLAAATITSPDRRAQLVISTVGIPAQYWIGDDDRWRIIDANGIKRSTSGFDTGVNKVAAQFAVAGTYWYWIDGSGNQRRREGTFIRSTNYTKASYVVADQHFYYIDENRDMRQLPIGAIMGGQAFNTVGFNT